MWSTGRICGRCRCKFGESQVMSKENSQVSCTGRKDAETTAEYHLFPTEEPTNHPTSIFSKASVTPIFTTKMSSNFQLPTAAAPTIQTTAALLRRLDRTSYASGGVNFAELRLPLHAEGDVWVDLARWAAATWDAICVGLVGWVRHA